jgi:hypothetical protein
MRVNDYIILKTISNLVCPESTSLLDIFIWRSNVTIATNGTTNRDSIKVWRTYSRKLQSQSTIYVLGPAFLNCLLYEDLNSIQINSILFDHVPLAFDMPHVEQANHGETYLVASDLSHDTDKPEFRLNKLIHSHLRTTTVCHDPLSTAFSPISGSFRAFGKFWRGACHHNFLKTLFPAFNIRL